MPTTIAIRLVQPGPLGDDVPAEGRIDFIPTLRREVDDEIVLPTSFSVKIGDALLDDDGSVLQAATPGTAWAQLEPTDAGDYAGEWAWRIAEKSVGGGLGYYFVPTSGSVVEFVDLVEVDPDSLDPEADPPAAWTLSLASEAALARNADNLTSGTVADARVASTLARDSEVSSAVAAEASSRTTVDATKRDKTTSTRPLVFYGNSYVVDNASTCTDGLEYHKQAAAELGTTATTFGVGARRTNVILAYLLNGAWSYASQGAHPLGAAATWAGMDTVDKIAVLDIMGNDVGHYPSVNVPAVPALISGAGGTRYVDGLKAALRGVLATINSASRVESSAASVSGSWTTVSNIGSGNSLRFTSANAASITYTVTPAQSGPFAGDVWHIGATLDTATGSNNAAFTASIDGGSAVAGTTIGWEQYTGVGGSAVSSISTATKYTLPVDGSSHTITIAHSGTAGHFLYSDAIVVPSANPLPVFFMAAPLAVKSGTAFTAPQAAIWGRNWRTIADAYRTIVAEFSNVYWVESSVSLNGLSNTDGLHPNDRGMEQRANDLVAAVDRYARGYLLGRRSADASDGAYAML